METLEPQVTGRRSAGGSFTIPEWCEHRRLSLRAMTRGREVSTCDAVSLGAIRRSPAKPTSGGRVKTKPKQLYPAQDEGKRACHSHPDCRSLLTLIAARHPALNAMGPALWPMSR